MCVCALQGGRAQNPILREDELLTKIKPGARKKAQQAQADLDPFAPEHGTQASLQYNDMLNREMLANTKVRLGLCRSVW